MNFTTRILSAAIALAAMTSAAHATVYTLTGRDISPATATGTITTDGTLGVLSQANITGVDITVADAAGPVVVGSLITLAGTDLTATATGLFFTYGGQQGNEYFTTYDAAITAAFCISTGSQLCNGAADNQIVVNGTAYSSNAAPGSTVEIATTGAVPEPATWALMLLGFGGVGVVLRRRGNGCLVPA